MKPQRLVRMQNVDYGLWSQDIVEIDENKREMWGYENILRCAGSPMSKAANCSVWPHDGSDNVPVNHVDLQAHITPFKGFTLSYLHSGLFQKLNQLHNFILPRDAHENNQKSQ